MFTSTSGLVTSPNYPLSYPDHLNCQLRIQAPEGNVISLFPYSIDTEIFRTGACIDKIKLYDGADPITSGRLSNQTFCGTTLPPSFVSSTKDFVLTFTSDYGTTHPGFAFTYMTHPPSRKYFDEYPSCNKVLVLM